MTRRTSGFTLMEVLVALAVLTVGVSAFGSVLDGFNRLRHRERLQVEMLEAASVQMERQVHSPPPCSEIHRDSVSARDFFIRVTINPIPGLVPVAWASVQALSLPDSSATPFRFERLVLCEKTDSR